MLLAIDTASRYMSIALHDGKTLRAERSQYSDNQHTVQLAAMIDGTLRETGLAPSALSGLALSEGPGSFSGLRIGFGVAKGLATALSLPLVAIPTLDILAAATPKFSGMLIAVIQAGRGRIIAGDYQWSDEGWRPEGAPEITTWQKLVGKLTSPCLVSGEIDENGHEALKDHRSIQLLDPAWRLRRAGFLAEAAWVHLRKNEKTADPTTINPVYLKGPG